jgi:hypothetical protein
MTKDGINTLFRLLHSTYQGRFNPTGDDGRMTRGDWYDALANSDDDETLFAAARYIAAGDDWPPTWGQLLQLTPQLESSHPSPGEAWEWAERNRGWMIDEPDETAKGVDPLVVKAGDQVGWYALYATDNSRDLAFARKNYIEVYEQLIDRDSSEQTRAAIEGPLRPGLELPKMKELT